MTYQEILLCNALLEAIPVDNIQPMDIAADIILLQVSYQRKVNEFVSFMQDSLKRMKSDKFDDLMINHKRFETLSKGDGDLTDDEKNELEELRKDEPEFEKQFAELDRLYQHAYATRLQKDVPDLGKMTKRQYQAVVAAVGFSGNIDVYIQNSRKESISKRHYLQDLCLNLVNIDE